MLDDILAATRLRIGSLNQPELRARAQERGPARPLERALQGGGISVIAEIKRRSPSRGELATDLDPARQARAYAAGGAAALSVLTEPEFFSGSLADLSAVSEEVAIPVLRKDFILEAAQVWEARAAGADAILLIVAALGDDQLSELLEEAATAGLDTLVEVHSAPEAERAMAAGARIVGVNNRDLTTFNVDLSTAEVLAPLLGRAAVRVAESGIWQRADAGRMAEAGYEAVLVGEALVKSMDPAALVAELRGVAG